MKIQKYIRRVINAGKSSLYRTELVEIRLTRPLSHKTHRKKLIGKR
jgi:hypothetical protein